MQAFLQKILLLSLLITGQFVLAQIKFSATVSSPQISKNEFVQLSLSIENAKEVQQIIPPAFKNFILVSGPNQESGMTLVNGVVRQYISLNYILKPKSAGNFKISPATAIADGKEVRSNSVTVKVSNTISPDNSVSNNINLPFADAVPESTFKDNILRKGENATEKINRNIFIKLELDKTACYVGEPITATYKLYTRLRSESNIVKNPSFNGFSVIDLQQPDNVSYRREKFNGREYNVYIVRKAQLYPLQPGNLELEPAEIENNISFIKEEYANGQSNFMNDLFGQFDEVAIPAGAIENHKVILQSKLASVNVKALPDANVPVSFKGAVGNFAIEAMPEKNNFTTDDAGKLKVIISGTGNLQLVNAPEILWPQGFENFDPSASDDFIKTSVPVSGRKIIDYSFTIAQPGIYVLPAIKFSYFNPKTGIYTTDSTKPITFSVTKGSGRKVSNAVPENKIKGDSFLNVFFSNRRWVVSLVAALILCGLFFWLKTDKKKETTIAKMPVKAEESKIIGQEIANVINTEGKNWLAKAGELLHSESPVFYNELNYALKNYLSKKLQLPIETINKKSITEQLDKKSIAVNTCIQLQQILNDIELQLYTPFAEKERKLELYNNTAAIIQLLETYKN